MIELIQRNYRGKDMLHSYLDFNNLDHLVNLCLTESAFVLGRHLCSHRQEGWVLRLGRENNQRKSCAARQTVNIRQSTTFE